MNPLTFVLTLVSVYEHRLKDYNNDPRTTFADIQRVLRLLEDHISERLREQQRTFKR